MQKTNTRQRKALEPFVRSGGFAFVLYTRLLSVQRLFEVFQIL